MLGLALDVTTQQTTHQSSAALYARLPLDLACAGSVIQEEEDRGCASMLMPLPQPLPLMPLPCLLLCQQQLDLGVHLAG